MQLSKQDICKVSEDIYTDIRGGYQWGYQKRISIYVLKESITLQYNKRV